MNRRQGMNRFGKYGCQKKTLGAKSRKKLLGKGGNIKIHKEGRTRKTIDEDILVPTKFLGILSIATFKVFWCNSFIFAVSILSSVNVSIFVLNPF